MFAEDVSCVGKYAFYNGYNGYNEYNNLTEVVLPSTMESIGDYAFQSCYNLSDINMDDATSLTSIGDNAFDNCDALTNINLGNATSLTSIGKYLMPVDFGLGDIPVLNLDDKDAELFIHGGFVDVSAPDGLARVYCGNFIGIGWVDAGKLKPKRTI